MTASKACAFATLIALWCVVVLSGCGVSTESDATSVSEEDVPFSLLAPSTSAPPTFDDDASQATIYLVSNNMLVPVATAVDSPPTVAGVLAELAPPIDEESPTLRTALPTGETIGSVQHAGRTVQIDLGEDFSQLTADEQLLAVAQIVLTATELPRVDQVTFTLGGEPVDVPRGDGSLTSDPVTRAEYIQLLSPQAG